MAKHNYSVVARTSLPDFEAERRYLTMETELAKREMHKLPARSWLFFSYPGLGLLRRTDWRKYIHSLERYGHQLDLLEIEIRGGLVPLSFSVIHEGSREDSGIKVHVMVDGGEIHKSKKPPKRPKRIDGAPDTSERHRFFGFEGFARKGIHIGRHGLEAEFSRLGSNDSALVVNQPLYVHTSKDTRLRYEIRSRGVPDGKTGEITLE